MHSLCPAGSYGGGAASKPHSDAAAEDAFDGASVEGVHDGLELFSICGGSRGAAVLFWPLRCCCLFRRVN